jgi:hypothetical protein
MQSQNFWKFEWIFFFFFGRVCCDWFERLSMNVVLSFLLCKVLWFIIAAVIGNCSFKTLHYFLNSGMIEQIIGKVLRVFLEG